MNSLRDIAHFFQEAGVFGLRSVSVFVPVLTPVERTSMRTMIAALQRLLPITLDVQIVGDSVHVVPFVPVFKSVPSAGVVSVTTLTLRTSNGVGVPGIVPATIGNPDNEFTFSLFRLNDPGEFVLSVERIGITGTGKVKLEESLQIVAMAKPVPPTPVVRPAISVQSNGDGSFTVNGTGFLAGVPVHIRVVDDTHQNDHNFDTPSDTSGKLLPFKTPNVCVNPGTIFFSANDGRKDPDDHPLGILFSNTVQMTCPG